MEQLERKLNFCRKKPITLGVIFTNILRAAFLYESVMLRSCSLLIVWLCNFFGEIKNIGKKAIHKMLVKLTIGCCSWLSL